MLSPIIISLIIVFAYFFYKPILTFKKGIYTGIWVVVAVVLLLNKMPLTIPFVKGYVGFSFLYVVMITGALNPQWKVTMRLKAVRAVYSIVGFVLLIVHPLNYASSILSQTRSIPWYGVISFIIMIPLFITSYIIIRKKMKPATWKNLQKFAYISYAFIFIHLLMQASTPQNKVVAIALFVVYGGLKAYKHTIGYQKKG